MKGKVKFLLRNYNENTNPGLFEQNSWINFTVLDIGVGYKVKRIEVLPRKQLSFQKNKFSAERWTIVQGTARVTVNDQTFAVNTGETIDFGMGEIRRVENMDNSEILVFINVQCGFNFMEEDFIRLSDCVERITDAV